MIIVVVSGSNRQESESGRIGALLSASLETMDGVTQVDHMNLREVDLPLWNESKRSDGDVWKEKWHPISHRLQHADGLLVVCPEWGGMAPPQLKNFLLLCDAGELAHKPGMLVGISASQGGAYVIAELRMSGYKNNQILWLPDHLIIRNVRDFSMTETSDGAQANLLQRLDYSLRLLISYARACRPIRETLVDPETFPYGM